MGWQQQKQYEVERKDRGMLSIPYASQCLSVAPVAHLRPRQDRVFAAPMRFSAARQHHHVRSWFFVSGSD